jgi:type III secretion protein D
MYELRILNGLHRGATLPLDEHTHVIGAREDADVVLLDSGVQGQHATLTLTESGWSLSSLDGDVLGAETNERRASVDLMPGEYARLGHVWVTVVASDADWEDPPPEPVGMPFHSADLAADGPVSGSADGLNDLARDESLPADAKSGASEERAAEQSASPASVVQDSDGDKPGWRKRHFAFVALAGATVLSACAAFAITGGPPPLNKLSLQADKVKPGPEGSNKAGGPLSPEQLRNAFRKRLTDVDLLKRFDLKLDDQSWSMQAALDDEEAARFERMLTAFVSTHKITFPIHAKVGSAEAMLPFTIRQVISGANASVVTVDGNRLYLGDEYRGVRLVAIDGSRLTFAGKRKIEVKW